MTASERCVNAGWYSTTAGHASYLYKCVSGSRRSNIYRGRDERQGSPANQCRAHGGCHCSTSKQRASAIAHLRCTLDIEEEMGKEEKERMIDVVTKGTRATWRRNPS